VERPDMHAAVCQLGIAPEVIYSRVTSGQGGEQTDRTVRRTFIRSVGRSAFRDLALHRVAVVTDTTALLQVRLYKPGVASKQLFIGTCGVLGCEALTSV